MTSFQREREALGARLRELRLDARITGRQLAESCGWQPSKVSKIESGKQTPTDADIQAWARECNSSEAVPDLVASIRSLESHYLEHRRNLRTGFTRNQRAYGDLESSASFIRTFESSVVPGLLQTADYARTRLASGLEYIASVDDVDAAVAARMERQHILYQSQKKFHFVLTEAALRYALCPTEVMQGQLDRLVSAAAITTVRLGIIAFDSVYQGPPPLHGFSVFDDRLARVETLTAVLNLFESHEVRSYLEIFERYDQCALHGAEARAFITRVMSELAVSEE